MDEDATTTGCGSGHVAFHAGLGRDHIAVAGSPPVLMRSLYEVSWLKVSCSGMAYPFGVKKRERQTTAGRQKARRR